MKLSVNKADEKRVLQNMDRLFQEICKRAGEAAKDAGEEYCAVVKSGIGGTEPPSFAGPWEPLSETWKSMKRGHTEEFWIETGGIRQAIRVDVLQNSMLVIEIFAGIRRQTNVWAFSRAMRNEYGYGRYQPVGGRPLFGPAMDTVSQRVGEGERRLVKGSRPYYLFRGVIQSAIRKVYG